MNAQPKKGCVFFAPKFFLCFKIRLVSSTRMYVVFKKIHLKRFFIMKTLRYSQHIFIILLFTLFACQPTSKHEKIDETVKLEVPELLERPELLGTAEERQYMIDTYNSLRNQIYQDEYNQDAKLKVAQLFMLEARVTGEHGHYYPASLKVLDHILMQNPAEQEKFQALLLQTSVYLSLHQFNKAKEVGETALVLNPHNALIYGALVDAYVELGNYEKAIELADKMVSIRPDMRSYARVSYLREIHGDIDGAIEAMKLAVSASAPGYEDAAWCRLTLGNLYENYGDLDAAEREYQQTLIERPNYPFAIAALAEIEVKKGNFEKAEMLLDQACEIIPEVGFYEQKASLYTQLGREEEAKSIIDEILLMLADDEANGHKMGIEYATLYRDLINDQEKALEYAKAEYEARPQNIDVNRIMASIYFKQGKIAEANEHIKKANLTNSIDPELSCLTGIIQVRSGNKIQGFQILKTALKKNPHQNHSFANEAKKYINKVG